MRADERFPLASVTRSIELDHRDRTEMGRRLPCESCEMDDIRQKRSDRLLRVMVVLTHGGKQEIAVRDSRQASLIGEHWNAVERYLSTGEASAAPQVPG